MIDYQPRRGVPCKFIATIMIHYKSCLGCHFYNPDDSPRLNFYQEVVCPYLDNHGCVCRKDFTDAATIVDIFNNKFPKAPTKPRPNQGIGARHATDVVETEHASARMVHSPSITPATSNPTLSYYSFPTPAPPETQTPHIPNQTTSAPSYNKCANLYFLIQTTLLCLSKWLVLKINLESPLIYILYFL